MTDLNVVELSDVAAHHEASRLLSQVWGQPLMEAGLITAFAHTGNYVAGAYLGPALVGVVIGFHSADGRLHSHVTGVRAGLRGQGIGQALKLHQRDWALEHGIDTVTWTFDPLVRRNAHFNLHRLGAVVTAYLPDFYGPMDDDLNAGSPSDRFSVAWDLTAEVAPVPSPAASLVAAGAVVLLDRAGDVPVPAGTGTGRVTLVAVPDDIEALRGARPDTAALWRPSLRTAFDTAFAAGLGVTGLTPDGFYVLRGTRP
ncbi:MAG: GNAT family N-acetyltransferase [Streptosporangiaceae bacterium]